MGLHGQPMKINIDVRQGSSCPWLWTTLNSKSFQQLSRAEPGNSGFQEDLVGNRKSLERLKRGTETEMLTLTHVEVDTRYFWPYCMTR